MAQRSFGLRFNIGFLVSAMTLGLALSCAQKTKVADSVPERVLPESANLIPVAGHNLRPHWINDSDLLFHSSQRDRHENFQLYLYDLKSQKERRVTFHDGDTESSAFSPKSSLLYYSSSTDEIKELSTLVDRHRSSVPAERPKIHPGLALTPTEIYSSRLDGSEIRRLTKSKGFDGNILFNEDSQRLLFASLEGSILQLFSMTPNGSDRRQLTTSPGHSLEPHYSTEQQRYVWVEIHPSGEKSILRVANNRFRDQTSLELPEGLYFSPRFLPGNQGILFSGFIEGLTEGQDLFIYKEDSRCLIRVVSAPGDQIQPEPSPDLSQIAFTHQTENSSQIALLGYPSLPTACLSLD